MPEERLVRFVAGPEGVVVPDVARKLPGRGLWVAANREAVDQAAGRRLLARGQGQAHGAARPLRPGGQAPEKPAPGEPRPCPAGRRSYLGIREGGERHRRRQDRLDGGGLRWRPGRAAQASAERPARNRIRAGRRRALFGVFSSEGIGLALGLGNVIHLAFLAGRGADRWTVDSRATFGLPSAHHPLSWREEPFGGRNG
ncbi:MAG: DUF448 domain-containing protein [Caulobacteraceae bacterium]